MELLWNRRPLTMRCRGSLMAIMAVLLSAAAGGAGLTGAFTEAMDRLSKQNVSAIGRDAMVSAYERLLRDYPDHPGRAKAMLELQGLWQQSDPRPGINPDEEKQDYWVRRAFAAAPDGSEIWFEAGFRYASALTWKDPKKAKMLLKRLYVRAPDTVNQTKRSATFNALPAEREIWLRPKQFA